MRKFQNLVDLTTVVGYIVKSKISVHILMKIVKKRRKTMWTSRYLSTKEISVYLERNSLTLFQQFHLVAVYICFKKNRTS